MTRTKSVFREAADIVSNNHDDPEQFTRAMIALFGDHPEIPQNIIAMSKALTSAPTNHLDWETHGDGLVGLALTTFVAGMFHGRDNP